jgi:glycosyltransferase involved in cell wall biosynthesis
VRARPIHQVIVGAGRGDAITSMASMLRERLRADGPSEIYAHHLPDDLHGDVLPLRDLGRGHREDLLIYHASMGEPAVTRTLLSRPERIVVVYHNITPSEFFLAHAPEFAANLHWGRHELSLLRNRVVLAVAVSDFNARDLAAQGFENVHVIPAGLHPSRLHGVSPNGVLADSLNAAFPHGFVLAVSQVLPHKRHEALIHATALVQWVHELPLGLVIVGVARLPSYQRALAEVVRRQRLERVWFAGSVTESHLSTYYRMATVFASTSAHEGLSLPPLEAMSFGLPVIAREAGALAETIGTAGLLLPPDAGPCIIAEALAEVATNEALRTALRHRGFERVGEIESADSQEALIALLHSELAA